MMGEGRRDRGLVGSDYVCGNGMFEALSMCLIGFRVLVALCVAGRWIYEVAMFDSISWDLSAMSMLCMQSEGMEEVEPRACSS
jgi:hypothetical protein